MSLLKRLLQGTSRCGQGGRCCVVRSWVASSWVAGSCMHGHAPWCMHELCRPDACRQWHKAARVHKHQSAAVGHAHSKCCVALFIIPLLLTLKPSGAGCRPEWPALCAPVSTHVDTALFLLGRIVHACALSICMPERPHLAAPEQSSLMLFAPGL